MRYSPVDVRRRLRAVLVLLAIALVLLLVLFFIRQWDARRSMWDDTEGEALTEIEYNGKTYKLRSSVESILVMGLDKFEDQVTTDSYRNDQLADFVMLLVFDKREKSCTAININRDTMTEVRVLGLGGSVVERKTMQLTMSHSYGSGDRDSAANTTYAVSHLLGDIPIHTYLSFTMDAVAELNDLCGGVTVTVTDHFEGLEDVLVMNEDVTLMGDLALTYVRARHGVEDASNINRMRRQSQYVTALYEKVKDRAGDDAFAIDAARRLGDYLVTNSTTSDLQNLLKRANDYSFNGIQTPAGESRVGDVYMEHYINEDALREMIVSLFYEPVD